MSYVSGRFVKAISKNTTNYTKNNNNEDKKVITGEKNLLEYLNCKKVVKTMQGNGIKNKMRNGKLYIFCKKELREDAKKYGIKFDWNLKLWYIPKEIEIENLKKLMNLTISLYGRCTSAGYQDYKYEIVIPLMLYIDENGEVDSYMISNVGGGYNKKAVFKLFEKE
jgi:hypothetical protein